MTSKSSTNKITLFHLMKEDMRHKTWSIALSALASFLLGPVAFSFCMSNYSTEYRVRYSYNYLNQANLNLQMFVALVGAVIMGIFTFRQIYSRRMMDLYHSAPVTRSRQFLAGYLNGIIVWFVPFLLGQIFVYAAALLTCDATGISGAIARLFLTTVGLVTLAYLIVYHAALVPVMVSGNLMNAFVNVLIYGLIVGALYLCGIANLMAYTDHFYGLETQQLLSPALMFTPMAAPFLLAYYANYIPFVLWGKLLAGNILVMVLNGCLAFLLYQKRPSEIAETGLENKGFKNIFRISVSVMSSMFLSLFFHFVADSNRMGWEIFGAVFGGALSFCILNIIYHATFKAVGSNKLQLGLVLFTCCLMVGALTFDWFGYDSYVPKKKDIKSISVYSNNLRDYSSTQYRMEDNVLVSNDLMQADPFHATRFTDTDAIYELLSTLASPEYDKWDRYDNTSRFTLHVKVETRHGTYYRSYRVSSKDWECVRPFIESDQYRQAFYPVQQGRQNYPAEIQLNPTKGASFQITDAGQIAEFMDAYELDFSEHRSLEYLTSTISLGDFGAVYNGNKDVTKATSRLHYYYELNLWDTHTINWLKKNYPEYTWDHSDAEIISYEPYFSISATKKAERKQALLYHLGLSQEEPAVISPYSVSINCSTVENTALLDALRPYLYFANHGNSTCTEYVEVGSVTTKDREYQACFIKRGEFPKELIDYLLEDAEYYSQDDRIESAAAFEVKYPSEDIIIE